MAPYDESKSRRSSVEEPFLPDEEKVDRFVIRGNTKKQKVLVRVLSAVIFILAATCIGLFAQLRAVLSAASPSNEIYCEFRTSSPRR